MAAPIRITASAKNASPTTAIARSVRPAVRVRSCQSTAVDAQISTTESRPKATSASDPAATPSAMVTPTSRTFQATVKRSRRTALRTASVLTSATLRRPTPPPRLRCGWCGGPVPCSNPPHGASRLPPVALVLGRLPGPPGRRHGPARRDERPQLLRPVLLQHARVVGRAVHGHGARAVPEPRCHRHVRVRAPRRPAARRARVEGPRRPHGHLDRADPGRGDRAAPQGSLRVRPLGARDVRCRLGRPRDRLRPHVGGRDAGVRGATAVRPQVRARALRHDALRADRLLVRDPRGGRRGTHRDARSLVGHA